MGISQYLATAANAFDHAVKRRVLAIDGIVRIAHLCRDGAGQFQAGRQGAAQISARWAAPRARALARRFARAAEVRSRPASHQTGPYRATLVPSERGFRLPGIDRTPLTAILFASR